MQTYNDHLHALLTELSDALNRALSDATRSSAWAAAPRHHALHTLLGTQQTHFVAAVLKQWHSQFAVDAAPPAATEPRPAEAGLNLDIDGLELVDEDRAVENIELLRATQLLESEAEAELRDLHALAATLRGDGEIAPKRHPLRPEALVHGIWQTVIDLISDRPAALLLMQGLYTPLAKHTRGAYRRAVQGLEAKGVEPAHYRAVQINPAISQRASAAILNAPEPSKPGYDITMPGALDALRELAQGVRADARQGGYGQRQRSLGRHILLGDTTSTEALPELQFNEEALNRAAAQLLNTDGSATEHDIWNIDGVSSDQQWLQSNLIRQHHAELSAVATNPLSREVITLLARIFDGILTDKLLLPVVRTRLARLQGSLLHIALNDPDLLHDHAQPSWQLLVRMAEHAAGFTQHDHPLLVAWLNRIDPWLDGVAAQAAPRAAHHAKALEALEAINHVDLNAALAQHSRTIERLQRAERRAALQALFATQLETQLTHPGIEPALRHFLIVRWAQYMVEIAMQHGADSTECRNLAIQFDELNWSLGVNSPQARQRLRGRLGQLAGNVAQALETLQVPSDERSRILDALMAQHAAIMTGQAPRHDAASGLSTQQEHAPAAWVDSGLIDSDQLETVPSALLDEPAAKLARHGDSSNPAAPAAWLASARPGMWCRVVEHGHWEHMRILWISTSRGYWLLDTPESTRPARMACTEGALTRLAQEGLARPLEARNLLERAVDQMVHDQSAHPPLQGLAPSGDIVNAPKAEPEASADAISLRLI